MKFNSSRFFEALGKVFTVLIILAGWIWLHANAPLVAIILGAVFAVVLVALLMSGNLT